MSVTRLAHRTLTAAGVATAIGMLALAPAHASLAPAPGDFGPVTTPQQAMILPASDAGGLDPIQLGAGLLAGVALTGAAVNVRGHRRHHHVRAPA